MAPATPVMPVDGPGRNPHACQGGKPRTFAGLLVLAPGLGAVPCQGSVLALQLLNVLAVTLGREEGPVWFSRSLEDPYSRCSPGRGLRSRWASAPSPSFKKNLETPGT